MSMIPSVNKYITVYLYLSIYLSIEFSKHKILFQSQIVKCVSITNNSKPSFVYEKVYILFPT